MENTMELTLEEFVDQMSLNDVLQALANICHGKADHLVSNWQDRTAAREWTKAGEKIDKLAMKISL